MKKVTTSTGKNVFINPQGLKTSNAFQSKSSHEFWIALNYGDKNETGKISTEIVGPFESLEIAEKTIETLLN